MTVDCDDASIKYELSDYFTFKVPSAEFMPSFRTRQC